MRGMGDFEPPDDYYGSDDEPECEWSDEDEADRLIKEIKEEGKWPWWK
jgi:hypothetical protein